MPLWLHIGAFYKDFLPLSVEKLRMKSRLQYAPVS